MQTKIGTGQLPPQDCAIAIHFWDTNWYIVVMRPRIDISDETRAQVVQFASEKGYTLPKAYAVLIERGLDTYDD